MAGPEGGTRPRGRVPKYRTSCDNCQTAKVKCGHEKPTCRRCLVHRVDCVYSLSRRMGRPRAKKVVSGDPDRRLPASTESNENAISKPATLGDVATDAEPAIIVAETLDAEAETNEPPVSEPKQADSWGPLFDDLGQLDGIAVSNQSEPTEEPQEDTMEFFSVESPLELGDMAAFAGISSFLDDLPSSIEPQTTTSALPEGQYESHEALPFSLPVAIIKTNTATMSLPQQHQSSLTSQCTCRHSSRPRREDSVSDSGNRGQSSRPLHFSPALFQDADCSSQEISMDTPSNISQPSDASSSLQPTCESASEVTWHMMQTEKKSGHCHCMATITQRIANLKTEQQSSSPMPIDCVLILEKEVEESLSLLNQCKNCRFDGMVHLLTLVSIRMMLDILQKTARSEFVAKPTSSSNSSLDATPLCIGSFKVPSRARFRFLRKALQARFHKLAALIEEREKMLVGNKQDCFSKSASFLLGDVLRSLRTIMGWIELWNAKHS